jgi:hypothetical protein
MLPFQRSDVVDAVVYLVLGLVGEGIAPQGTGFAPPIAEEGQRALSHKNTGDTRSLKWLRESTSELSTCSKRGST